jgi:Tc5 transposase DNA-binding domain
MYSELENELKAWIVEKNQKGLRVRDQSIQEKALSLFNFRENIQVEDDESYPVGQFLASSGWLHYSRSVKAWLGVARIHAESCLTMQMSWRAAFCRRYIR